MSERKCIREWCNNTVVGNASRTTCSKKCSQNRPPAGWKAATREPVECANETCSVMFKGTMSKQKFCSKKCCVQHHNRITVREKKGRIERPRVISQSGATTIYKTLKAYGLVVSHSMAKRGYNAVARMDTLEAINGKNNGVLTHGEYMEELRIVADRHKLDWDEYMDYVRSINVKPITFHKSMGRDTTHQNEMDHYVDLPELSLS